MAGTSGAVPEVGQGRALLAFALGALFFSYAFMQRVAPSVMADELMRDFAVGATALGSLSASYFYAYASIQVPVGVLTDRYGPRKLMSVAAALAAVASLVFACSDSLWLASLARALVGVTVAFAFVGTMAIAGYWFAPRKYAMLAGVLQTVGVSGAIFGQAPLRHVIESVGWRGMSIMMAVIAFVLAGLIYWRVPRRTASQRVQADHPPPAIASSLRSVAGNPQTWICALIGFGMAATMLGFGGLWAVPWLSGVHGYSTTEAAQISSMLFVGWAVFAPFLGWFSELVGRRNPVLVAGCSVSLVAFAVMVFKTPSSTPWLLLLMFLTGVGGCGMTVAFSSVKELNSLRLSSTSLGLMNMFIVGSGAVMQPLIGWLLDLHWDGAMLNGVPVYSASAYRIALASFLVTNTAALLGALFVRETYCRSLGRSLGR